MKRYISSLLAFILVMSYLPITTFANYQQPIKEVTRVEISHQDNPTPGQDQIYPNLSVAWIEPDPNLNNPANHQDQTPRHLGYDLVIRDLVTGNEETQEGLTDDMLQKEGTEVGATFGFKGDRPANINDPWETFLKSGTLYQIDIQPYHFHVVTNANGNIDRVKYKTLDPTARNGSPAFAITDFNITADVSDGLSYSFEYIPGVTYELYYGVIDPNDLPEMPSEITANPRIITPEEAAANSANGMVTWKIDNDRVLPGQPYAAAVVPRSIEAATGNGLTVSLAPRVRYNNASSRSPKITYATPELKLYLYNIYEDRIRLVWETLPAWLQINNNLESITIIARKKGAEDDAWETLATFTKDLQYFDYLRPDEETEYQVIFQTSNLGQIRTNIASSEVVEVLDIPYAPRVPTEFPALEVSAMDTDQLNAWLAPFDNLNQFLTADERNYDDVQLRTRVDVPEFTNHTFHYSLNSNNTANIQLVWDVMKEQKTESPLFYDIYVSEDLDSIDNVGNRVYTDLPSSEVETIVKSDGTLVGNKVQLPVSKTNTTYHIKIIAKSMAGNNVRYWSPPTTVSITIEKVGDIFEPPVLGKPPLQVEAKIEDGAHQLDVKWTKEWYEVQVKDTDLLQRYSQNDPDDELSHNEQLLAKYGMSKIYLYTEGESPYLRYIPKSGNETTDTYELYGTNVADKLREIESKVNAQNSGEADYYKNHYLENHLNLGDDTHYEMLVMSDTDFANARGNKTIEDYISGGDILVDYPWTPIDDYLSSTVINGVDGLMYSVTQDYQGAALEPNKNYIIMLRTYRYVNGEQKWCIMPSYIIGTTLSDFTSDPVVPKTPVLSLDSVDMTKVTVTWPYDETFDYELVYSRFDDPNTATVWTFTEDDLKTFVKGQNAKATVTGLLPDTNYNFWIRAKQKAESVGGEENVRMSEWSNPVSTKTLELTAPNPPGGLGLASYQSILEAGQDFMPRLSDSLTLEWSRLADDLDPSDPAITYSYRIEFSNNLEFMDSIIVNTTTGETNNGPIPFEVIAKNIVRFTELEANSPYYARVQAIMTYQKEDKVITLESEWTQRVRLTTTTSNEEYDGGDNPYVTIYPEPVVQTYRDGVWTYELVDAAKLTTQILNAKAQNYAIQLNYYNGNQDANKRIVKMPMKIMQTLHNQGMNLQLITNIGTYEIPAKSLESYIAGYGATDTAEFDLTKLTAEEITTYIKEGAYQTGERLEIKLRNAATNTPIYTLNQPMTVRLKTDIEGEYNISDKQPYLYNYNKGEWAKQNAALDNHFISYTTPYVGLNALYGEIFEGSSQTSDYLMNALGGLYDIKGNYKIEDNVSASQYVSLLLGIARNADTIDLTTSATETDYNAAKASGLYISNVRGAISKEQALNGCVRLYEMKHGNAIKPSNADLNGFSSNYQQAAQKAYAVGMISTVSNPQETITYGELFDWLAMAVDGV